VKFSIVLSTWKRPLALLGHTLFCLTHQSLPPLEIIVVDLNDDDTSIPIRDVCNWYHARRVSAPLGRFHLSRAQNVGIKRTSEEADFVLCTGLEMMFSQNYLSTLATLMAPDRLALGVCGCLEEHVEVPDDPFSEWDRLVASVEHTSKNQMSPGTLQCASRDWWFKVHGYDESLLFAFTDSDIIRRSWLDGLKPICFGWDKVQVIHQWHPPSELIYKDGSRLLSVIQRDMTIIRNPDGWGELDESLLWKMKGGVRGRFTNVIDVEKNVSRSGVAMSISASVLLLKLDCT